VSVVVGYVQGNGTLRAGARGRRPGEQKTLDLRQHDPVAAGRAGRVSRPGGPTRAGRDPPAGALRLDRTGCVLMLRSGPGGAGREDQVVGKAGERFAVDVMVRSVTRRALPHLPYGVVGRLGHQDLVGVGDRDVSAGPVGGVADLVGRWRRAAAEGDPGEVTAAGVAGQFHGVSPGPETSMACWGCVDAKTSTKPPVALVRYIRQSLFSD
jgi:hypothetical protein